MITQIILILALLSGIGTNAYYAGKGEYLKKASYCLGDAVIGTGILLLVIFGWNL